MQKISIFAQENKKEFQQYMRAMKLLCPPATTEVAKSTVWHLLEILHMLKIALWNLFYLTYSKYLVVFKLNSVRFPIPLKVKTLTFIKSAFYIFKSNIKIKSMKYIWLKPIKFCKAIILQLKNKQIFLKAWSISARLQTLKK